MEIAGRRERSKMRVVVRKGSEVGMRGGGK